MEELIVWVSSATIKVNEKSVFNDIVHIQRESIRKKGYGCKWSLEVTLHLDIH